MIGHDYADGVGTFGQVGDARIAREAEQFVVARINRIDFDAVSGLHDRAQKATAVLHPLCGSNDRNRAGVEHFVDRGELRFCPVVHLMAYLAFSGVFHIHIGTLPFKIEGSLILIQARERTVSNILKYLKISN